MDREAPRTSPTYDTEQHQAHSPSGQSPVTPSVDNLPAAPPSLPPDAASERGALEIRAEQTRLLAEGIRTTVPASIAIGAVMAYIQWPVIAHGLVAGWLSALVLVSLLRGLLALRYLRADHRGEDPTGWYRASIAGTALAGAVWGLGAWLLYPPDNVAHQAFLGVLIAGVSAGAVSSLSASLSAVLAFVALSLPPLAIRFMASDQEVIVALGLLTLLFLGVTAVGARRMNGSILQNVRLRLDSDAQVSALRASEERTRKLSMVAARTDNAVIITDRAGRIEWINDGFTRMTGYGPAEVAGRTPGSVLQGPGTDAQAVQRMRERLQRGQGFAEEVLNYTKGGTPYWVSIEVQPILDNSGATVKFMAIERDVTEARTRERQLEEARRVAESANQAKSNFLALMSHEIRTPLNGVLGSLGLLQDTVLTPEQRKFVDTSQRSADWLLSIINSILDFSKMEAGKVELEPAAFSVAALVDNVVEMLEPRASEKAISIVAEVDPDVPRAVESDPSKIRQVLLNLAGNAVKFTARGEVRIRVSLLEGDEQALRLRFTVSDTGVGIAPEQQARVFEEFWTRSEDSSHVNAGTGLGLSISRRLVHILGGEIQLESRQGTGTRFWFDIPVTPVSPEQVAANETGASDGAGTLAFGQGIQLSGRVLVAEDNSANQLVAQSLLKRLGLIVDVVGNGVEAVDAASSRPYDIILMDIGMPDMDGIAATRAIRALSGPNARVPIVAVTAHVMRGERDSLLSQGFDDYLPKPIDRNALLDCLTRWLTREAHQMTAPEEIDVSSDAHQPSRAIDRRVLDQLLKDVGPENGEAVVDAFILELDRQAVLLEDAADRPDLDAMSQAAHRLKGRAASFGATRLSRLAASIEQAARTGRTESAVGSMREFRGLAKSSKDEMDALRREIFGAGG